MTGTARPLRLDFPPPESARIALPEGFGRRFAVFADAEEEFDWTKPFNRESTGVTAVAALPDGNKRFAAAGCRPVYLCDWPIVDKPESADIIAQMLADGTCDIGTQLHPWVNPPFLETVSGRNSYLGNLPVELQRAKLHALTDRIEQAFGRRPIVYRAGRYGIGKDTAGLLADAGYRLDVSIRARFNYRRNYGPDFSYHPVWPWRLSPTLAELPLTTAISGPLRHSKMLREMDSLKGVLSRTRLLDRVPLTPEGVLLDHALAGIRRLIDDGHQLFSLSFHTPTLVPGHTPYVRNQTDLDTFWRWWDGVFNLFAREGITAVGLDEIVEALVR